jgi:hypothetical protein
MEINEHQMLEIGLRQLGRSEYQIRLDSEKAKHDRFKTAYGASSKVCCLIYQDIKSIKTLTLTLTGDAKKELKPKAYLFLMTLHWLKRYPVEAMMSTTFSMNEDTVRKWVWLYSAAIQALKPHKVGNEIVEYL